MGTDAALGIAEGLCKTFEGLSLTPYQCPAGVWTIGIGTTRYEDGTPVTQDDPPITETRALELMRHELLGCVSSALRASPRLATLPRSLGAIASFVFNLGAGRYRASTLRRRIDAGDWLGARDEIVKWARGGGKILRGLVLRRQAEAALLGL